MSLPQAIVAITSPMSAAVTVGTPQTVGAVVFANESPYAVQALAGGSGKWVSPQTADVIYTNSAAFDGSLALTTNDILDNSTAAPSFVGLLTTYAPGEPIPGTYPVALPRMSNVGNTVTTTGTSTPANNLEQDVLTPFVLNGLAPTKISANILQVASGVGLLRQSDASLGRVACSLQNLSIPATPNTTFYCYVNPDGAFSVGTSQRSTGNPLSIATVTTDAAGAILTVTDTRPLATTLLVGAAEIDLGNGTVLGAVGGPLQIKSALTVDQSVQVNQTLQANGVATFPAGLSAGSTGFSSFTINAVGQAFILAPDQLLSGQQETGYASGAGVAAAGGNAWGFGVNFKTVMTNVPTISLSASSSSNCSAAANNITKYGFSLVLTATAAGSFFWVGSYTTVGN